MHTIKLLLTYYLNISVQAANLSDCRIESNRKKIDSVAWVDLGPTHRRLRHRETASGLHQCVPCTLPLSTSPKIGARSSAMNVSVYMLVRSHISKIHKSNFTNSRGQRQRYSPERVDVIKRSVWPRSSIESRFTGCFFPLIDDLLSVMYSG